MEASLVLNNLQLTFSFHLILFYLMLQVVTCAKKKKDLIYTKKVLKRKNGFVFVSHLTNVSLETRC